MERQQKAEALARLLVSTKVPSTGGHSAEDGCDPSENGWAASVLLYRFLSAAGGPEPLDRPTLESLIAAAAGRFGAAPAEALAALESLERRAGQRFRDVLGRSVIPLGWRGVVMRSEKEAALSELELGVLGLLHDARHRSIHQAPTIRHAEATRIHAAHSAIFTETPPLAVLGTRGYLAATPMVDEFTVLPRPGVGESGVRAAALLWEEGLRLGKEAHSWLREWMDRVAAGNNTLPSALRWMTRSARGQFLDAALETILAEPDLIGWREENDRLWRDPRSGAEELAPPVTESSPLARYRRYEDHFGRRLDSGHSDERGEVVGLIAAIVEHDSLEGPIEERCKRILALIRAGDTRPFLSFWVPWFMIQSRRATIAWLVFHDDTASLGAQLIEKLEIAEDSTWPEQAERARRQVEQRGALWDATLRVLFCPPPLERTPAIAATCAEVLQIFGASSFQPGPDASAHQIESAKGVTQRLQRIVDVLRRATCEQRYEPGTGRRLHENRLLPHVLRSIFETIANTPPKFRSLRAAHFPLGQMRLLALCLGLVDEARLTGAASANADIPTGSEIAIAIVERYRRELRRELHEMQYQGQSFIDAVDYFGDEPGLVELPWGAITVALDDTDSLECLLSPVDFHSRICAISDTAQRINEPTRTEGVVWNLTHAWAARLRQHFRVLLSSHTQAHATGAPAPLLARIERAIGDLIAAHIEDDVANGALAIFNHADIFGSEMVNLAVATAEVIGGFGEPRRARIYESWILSLQGVGLLLAARPAIATAAGRALADKIIAERASGDVSSWEFRQSDFERFTQDAIEANRIDLAERAVSAGAEANVYPLRRQAWEEFEYRTRASIAYRRKDRLAFIALRAPEATADRDRTLRVAQVRGFYDALFRLDEDPDGAVKMFAELEPERSASVANNLFVARLRVADALEDGHRRRTAFAEALRDWRRMAINFEPLSPASVRFQSLNTLVALNGARRDDEFDVTWAALQPRDRYEPCVLEVLVANAKRRGRAFIASAILDDAGAYHGDSMGAGPPTLADLQRQLASDAPASSPRAVAELTTTPHRDEDLHTAHHRILDLPAHRLAEVQFGTPDDGLGEIDRLGEVLLLYHLQVAYVLVDRKVLLLPRDNTTESRYNAYFSELLQARVSNNRWQVHQEPPGGLSHGATTASIGSGGVGERDWIIRDQRGQQLALTEAYRLRSRDSEAIERHITKLPGYNAVGTPHSFVVVYVESKLFAALVERYLVFVKSCVVPDWLLVEITPHDNPYLSVPATSVSTLKAIYETPYGTQVVFHLLVHLYIPEAGAA